MTPTLPPLLLPDPFLGSKFGWEGAGGCLFYGKVGQKKQHFLFFLPFFALQDFSKNVDQHFFSLLQPYLTADPLRPFLFIIFVENIDLKSFHRGNCNNKGLIVPKLKTEGAQDRKKPAVQ